MQITAIRKPLRSSLTALVLYAIVCCAGSSPLGALTEPWDHSLFDQLLKKYVSPSGEVDYEGIKNDPEKRLERYLEKASKIGDSDKIFEIWPREETLAYWLNVYHAALIKAVLQYYPVKSINDIPGIWDLEMIAIGKDRMSLNSISERYLMTSFRDEKIHLALSLTAKSSPPFPREAFTGPKVEGQLFLAARDFVNNPANVQITPGEKNIFLSRIFDWYAADFRLDFGVVDQDKALTEDQFAVLSFITHYLKDFDQVQFLEEGKFKIKYFPFDWSLNDWKRHPSA